MSIKKNIITLTNYAVMDWYNEFISELFQLRSLLRDKNGQSGYEKVEVL